MYLQNSLLIMKNLTCFFRKWLLFVSDSAFFGIKVWKVRKIVLFLHKKQIKIKDYEKKRIADWSPADGFHVYDGADQGWRHQ